MKGLAGRLGIELDAGDVCSFEADGMVVSMYFPRESDFIAMSCDLGEPPPDCGEKLLRRRLLTIRLHGFGTMRVMKQFGIIRKQH